MIIETLSRDEFPPLLREIPDAPEKLFVKGAPIPEDHLLIAVVGSRKYTQYGRSAVEYVVRGLRGYNIVIVSGLALGIDSLAHRAALANNIHTVAVPGSSIDPKHIYPRSNFGLSEEILKKGGTLLSEFEADSPIFPSNFPQRNRIMAGMSHATLVVEATPKSGTLITARLALEYNREVYAIPGSILSDSSRGTNELIRDGATPVLSASDIIEGLGLVKKESGTDESAAALPTLDFPDSLSKEAFIKQYESPTEALRALSKLELEGKIRVQGNVIYKTSG